MRVLEEEGYGALKMKQLKHVEMPDDENLPTERPCEGDGVFVPISQTTLVQPGKRDE